MLGIVKILLVVKVLFKKKACYEIGQLRKVRKKSVTVINGADSFTFGWEYSIFRYGSVFVQAAARVICLVHMLFSKIIFIAVK